ncbi:hypothetical protein EJB05_37815, partial [Eragrostis curvula]
MLLQGGVSEMEPSLKRLFRHILERMAAAKGNESCIYDSQTLTAFTSSLYVAGLVASLVADPVAKAMGRQAVMLMGGIAMLIVGRMLLGFRLRHRVHQPGQFTVYQNLGKLQFVISAMHVRQGTVKFFGRSPVPRRDGTLAVLPRARRLGVLIANLTNYATASLSWGWRFSLGLAGAPAVIIVVSALFLTDTPSSLVMHGRVDQAKATLRRVRGPGADVDAELKDIVRAVDVARRSEDGALRRIATRRDSIHVTGVIVLVLGVAVPTFTFFQLTGVVVLSFLAPLIFRTVGFGSNAALMHGAVILGAVNLGSLDLALHPRHRPFVKVAVAWIMGAKVGERSGEAAMARPYAVAVLVLTCLDSAGFGWSWGPLGWMVAQRDIPGGRPVGGAGHERVHRPLPHLRAVQTQSFLAMLCRF